MGNENTKFIIKTLNNEFELVEYTLDFDFLKEKINQQNAEISKIVETCKSTSDIKSAFKKIEQFDQSLLGVKRDIESLSRDISRKAGEKKTKIFFAFWWKTKLIENESRLQIRELLRYIIFIDCQLKNNSSFKYKLNNLQRQLLEQNIPNLPELENKYKEGVRANETKQTDLAYNLLEECYNSNYKAADAAAILGLISFNEYDDIEKARIWFVRAANLNTPDTFVYLYIGEIWQANGLGIPEEISIRGIEKGISSLNPKTVGKIHELVRKNNNRRFE